MAVLQVAGRGQSLMRAAMSQFISKSLSLHPEIGVHPCRSAGSEEIQSTHLAEALHASQSFEVAVELIFYNEVGVNIQGGKRTAINSGDK